MNLRGLLSPAVAVSLVFGLVLRVWLIFVTPVAGVSLPGEICSYNDEIAHVNYIRKIVEHGRLPNVSDPIDAPGALERGLFESYQPPLYYLFTAGVCKLLSLYSPSDITYAGRWISLLFGVLMIIAWSVLAPRVGISREVTRAGVIFLSLSAVVMRFTSTAGNESLAWLFCGLWIFAITEMCIVGRSWRVTWLSIAVATLAIWTKLSIVPLLPLWAAPILFQRGRVLISRLLLIAALTLFLTIPVWWRNFSQFGSLIPLESGFGAPAFEFPGWTFAVFAIRSTAFPWWELWHPLLDLLSIAALGLVFFYGFRRKIRYISRVFLIAIALSIAAFIALNFQYRQAEGRYFFVAWPSLAMLAAPPQSSTRAEWLLFAAMGIPLLHFII